MLGAGWLPTSTWLPHQQKTTVPIALQLPLPSVRLRLTASSPAGGRSLFGWLSTEGDSQAYEPSLCKGRWLPEGQTEGLYVTSLAKYNPSAPTGQLPLHKGAYTGGFYRRWTAKTDGNILVFLGGDACQLGVGEAAKSSSAADSRPAPRR